MSMEPKLKNLTVHKRTMCFFYPFSQHLSASNWLFGFFISISFTPWSLRNYFHFNTENIHVEDQGYLHFWISRLIVWNFMSIGHFKLLSHYFVFATSTLPRASQTQKNWRHKKRNPQASSRSILFLTKVKNSRNIKIVTCGVSSWCSLKGLMCQISINKM